MANSDERFSLADIETAMQHFDLHDEAAVKTLFSLFNLLAPRYKDGKLIRQEGRLSIVPMGPGYQASLDCPHEGVTGSVLLESLVGALERIEEAILTHKVLWKQHYKKRRRDLTANNRPSTR